MANSEKHKPKKIVLGFDVLVDGHLPEIAEGLRRCKHECEIFIPASYIDYLSDPKKYRPYADGDEAKEVLNFLTSFTKENGESGYLKCGAKFTISETKRSRHDPCNDALDLLRLIKEKDKPDQEEDENKNVVVLLSNNSKNRIAAQMQGYKTAPITEPLQKGYIECKIPEELKSDWNINGVVSNEKLKTFIPADKLRPNLFVHFTNINGCGHNNATYANRIGRIETELNENGDKTLVLKKLHYILEYPVMQAVNLQQAMYLEALLAPDIPLIHCEGKFGTGKTSTAIAAALQLVYCPKTCGKTNYEQIYVIPPDEASGKTIGYLPGTVSSKLTPRTGYALNAISYFLRLYHEWEKQEKIAAKEQKKHRAYGKITPDNNINASATPQDASRMSNCSSLDSLEKEETEYHLRQMGAPKDHLKELTRIYLDVLTILPASYMLGCSLSDCIIIVDEAQNFTKEQIKLLLNRIGTNAKIIVTGDPDNQILNDEVGAGINGLTSSKRRLEGNNLAACFTLTECLRSEAALSLAVTDDKERYSNI